LNSKIKKQKSKLPFVSINMAMTADGKIATANRAILRSAARGIGASLRTPCNGGLVMCGARTMNLAKHPGNGRRKISQAATEDGLAEYICAHCQRQRLHQSAGRNLKKVFAGHNSHDSPDFKTQLTKMSAVADEVKICGKNEINFRKALHWLHAKWGVKWLLCEGAVN